MIGLPDYTPNGIHSLIKETRMDILLCVRVPPLNQQTKMGKAGLRGEGCCYHLENEAGSWGSSQEGKQNLASGAWSTETAPPCEHSWDRTFDELGPEGQAGPYKSTCPLEPSSNVLCPTGSSLTGPLFAHCSLFSLALSAREQPVSQKVERK